VLSITGAAKYEPSGREVCISITDPQSAPANLSEKFAAVLRLSFSDITEPIPLPTHVLFAPEHAHAILDFIDNWPDVERIVVHCVGGLSRSPGVALAIADLRGWPVKALEQRSPMWNKWVREQLVSVGRARDLKN
jgi:predicted protein tyrosine phosphatase